MAGNAKQERAEKPVKTDLERLVSAQANHVRKILTDLHISNITVSDSIQHTVPPELSDSLNVAISIGIGKVDEVGVSLFLAGQVQQAAGETPITPLLILPGLDSQPLLYSDSAAYTDGFWIMHGTTLQYVSPPQPVPVHGMLTMYDQIRDQEAPAHLYDAQRSLFPITENKELTKEILQRAGINVPPGIFLSVGEKQTLSTLHEKIEDFSSSIGNHDIVVKINDGSQGTHVYMFHPAELAEAETCARKLLEKGHDVIVEKRILPEDVDARRVVRANLANTDYNARILATASKENPHIIDGEVRYDTMGEGPVNVSLSAQAARLDYAYPPEVIKDMYATSIEATKAICNALGLQETELIGLLGLDLIVEKDTGIVYVIEVNSGAVGGPSTLTKIDGKPLESFGTTFYPYLRPFLTRNRDIQIADSSETELTRVSLTEQDRLGIIELFKENHDIATLMRITDHYLKGYWMGPEPVAKIAILIATEGKNKKQGFKLMAEVEDQYSRPDEIAPYRAQLLLLNNQEEQAIEILRNHFGKLIADADLLELTISAKLEELYKDINPERANYFLHRILELSGKVTQPLLLINGEPIDITANSTDPQD